VVVTYENTKMASDLISRLHRVQEIRHRMFVDGWRPTKYVRLIEEERQVWARLGELLPPPQTEPL
jgi:hypothetical protein